MHVRIEQFSIKLPQRTKKKTLCVWPTVNCAVEACFFHEFQTLIWNGNLPFMRSFLSPFHLQPKLWYKIVIMGLLLLLLLVFVVFLCVRCPLNMLAAHHRKHINYKKDYWALKYNLITTKDESVWHEHECGGGMGTASVSSIYIPIYALFGTRKFT